MPSAFRHWHNLTCSVTPVEALPSINAQVYEAFLLPWSLSMCNKCYTHSCKAAETPDCHSGTPIHIGLFAISTHAVLFPGEVVHLHVYVASSLRLIADLYGGQFTSRHDDDSWPGSHLITRAFAVAPSRDSPYGAIATFAENSTVVWMGNCARLKVRIVGRYQRLSEARYHSYYPCLLARMLCDSPTPRLLQPSHRAFPYLTPHPSKRALQTAILTRSAAKNLRSRARLRSSAAMGGLSYSHWLANQPQELMRRIKLKAVYARLRFDKLLLDNAPDESYCPGAWSFWLAAGLAEDTPNEKLYPLLAETSVTGRLRLLLRLMEDRIAAPPRKRRRTTSDRAFRMNIPKRKKTETSLSPSKPVSSGNREQTERVTNVEPLDPWPCAGGFKSIGRWICRGRFDPLLTLISENEKCEESDVSMAKKNG